MKEAFKYAFPLTIPIMAGYLFLGASFGILAYSQGIPTFIAILMSILIYAGSMQFAAVPVIIGSFNPVGALLLTIMVNARHIFYGITMLKPYSQISGWKKIYTIFGLTDETFSLVAGIDIPEDISRDWAYFHITWLDHLYWVTGTIIGVSAGQLITFNTQGIEFVLTALFVTIFVEQWLSSDNHEPALIGLIAGVVCRLFFGADTFLIPAMFAIIVAFLIQYARGGQEALK